MKKQRKSNKTGKSKRRNAPAVPEISEGNDRRRMIKLLRNGAIAAVLLGGGGSFAIGAVRATVHEQDLSRVGAGTPSIVQIHDPGCTLCTALQRETRKALEAFDTDQIEYVVANIKTTEGSQFAARYGQPHVTLMLMDPKGAPVRVLNGPQTSDDLERVFAAHIAAFE